MILTTDMLKIEYKNYADINGKIGRDVRSGRLIPIKRGLYETNADVPGYMLSQYIYAPSYISFDYVLYIHDMIPEAVYKTFGNATIGKQKTKKYTNYFGTYLYRDIPQEVYPLGVRNVQEQGYSYNICTLEKALCDKLYTLNSVNSMQELKKLLFDDLRIDEDKFWAMDREQILSYAPKYGSKNLNLLKKLFEKGK